MVDDETTGRQWLPPEDPDEVREGMKLVGEWMRNVPEGSVFVGWSDGGCVQCQVVQAAMWKAHRAGRDVLAAGLAVSPQPEVGDLDRDDLRGAVDQRE